MDFYTGRVLRLDLTRLRASVEPLDPDRARLYVGGKGLLLRYLFAELAAGTEALAAENPLILAAGPFAGAAVATCSRLAVGCKSPATGTLLDSLSAPLERITDAWAEFLEKRHVGEFVPMQPAGG